MSYRCNGLRLDANIGRQAALLYCEGHHSHQNEFAGYDYAKRYAVMSWDRNNWQSFAMIVPASRSPKATT